MIEIDLLPLELRKKKKILFAQLFKPRPFLIFLGCLLLFHLLLYAVTAASRISLNKVKRNWQALSFTKSNIVQLKNDLREVNEKIALIDQLISNRLLWSEKLNRTSDLMIGGIWLNGMSIESESLIIQGSAASRTKDEPALIGRFMQNLKDDHSFSRDFAEIELGPIKKRYIMQTEIMDFILICRFKQKIVQALIR